MVALDSNVLIALWDVANTLNQTAAAALQRASHESTLVISGPVYAELLAGQGRTETLLDRFFGEAGIGVDWDLDEPIWRLAGARFQRGARRRHEAPRRILANFLIGAHAVRRAEALLTLDVGVYRRVFPELALLAI